VGTRGSDAHEDAEALRISFRRIQAARAVNAKESTERKDSLVPGFSIHVLTYLPTYPLTHLEQRRQCGPVLAQVVEQFTHVCRGRSKDGEPIATGHVSHDEESALVLQHGGAKCTSS
jgi:hypothetical protein